MSTDFENETWVIEEGDRIIQKEARAGAGSLTPWEQLVYCLWVADYMMRNAGDFANAVDMYPELQTDAGRLAEQLSLPLTREAFSLSQSALQREYFARFMAVCDEIRSAGALGDTARKESMSELHDFEIVGDHAEYRPTGELALDQATQLITSGIAFARKQKLKKLMVVTLGLAGFQPPNVIQRYYFIHEWANASGFSVRVAIVAHPEMIDPRKFGVTVAFNIGFASDVFTSEEEALTWLRSVG
jgi:hypothetical protein